MGNRLLPDGFSVVPNEMHVFNHYQNWALNKWFGPREMEISVLGIAGESGEVCEKVKKYLRGDDVPREAVAGELGDVLYYIATTADYLGYTLQEIVDMNVTKITRRVENNTQRGDGDDR